jgi:hypothetical protein
MASLPTGQRSVSSPLQPTNPSSARNHGDLSLENSQRNAFKLRLTTRLRDFLALENYSIEAAQAESFFNMFEAEALPAHHEKMADDECCVPSWQICSFESLTKAFDLSVHYKPLKLHSNNGSKESMRIDHVPVAFVGKPLFCEHSTRNQPSAIEHPMFNVVWLSPTVFISPLFLETNSVLASDYRVILSVSPEVGLGWSANFHVYTMSAFEVGPGRQEMSPLPFAFLRSMTKSLPIDYFSSISVSWYQARALGRDLLPSLCLEFLSIFPLTATEPQSYKQRLGRTRCVFSDPLNREQFSAILSSSLLTENSLCLDLAGGSHWDDTTHLVPGWNAALRESRTLRHVFLPWKLSRAVWDKHDVPFTINSCIESLSMLPIGFRDALPFFLDGVARNDGIKSIYMEYCTLHEECRCEISYLFSKVLPKHPSLKEVSISIQSYGLRNERPLDRFLPFFAEWTVAAKRINLVRFSFTYSHWSEPVLPSTLFHDWWDMNMAPILVMNWYRNDQKQSENGLTESQQRVPSNAIHLPKNLLFQALAVNRGNVYRMVTTQVAVSDPTTANASILFEILRGHLHLPKSLLITN